MSLKNGKVFVSAGMIAVGSRTGILTTVGLGSCVAIAIDDPIAAVGGLTHIFLPAPTEAIREVQPGRYVSTAIPLLVDRVITAGAQRVRLRARMAGGAAMFPALLATGAVPLGLRNVKAARDLLKSMGIPLVAEETGGHSGRTVILHLEDGRFVVRSTGAHEVVL